MYGGKEGKGGGFFFCFHFFFLIKKKDDETFYLLSLLLPHALPNCLFFRYFGKERIYRKSLPHPPFFYLIFLFLFFNFINQYIHTTKYKNIKMRYGQPPLNYRESPSQKNEVNYHFSKSFPIIMLSTFLCNYVFYCIVHKLHAK